ncbi:MAG: glycosyltransferase family 2 protein [Alphaproteobacteria bacterium]
MTPSPAAPDVSVIIPTWKAAAFVGKAVASALASTGLVLEVVIIDDASPDNTFEVIQRLAVTDTRVKVDRLAVNSGPSVARNRAIALSTGRYIAVLDADDTITPDRLARLAQIADQNGSDIVVDNMIEVDDEGRRISTQPFLRSPAFAEARTIDLATWVDFNLPMKPGDCLGYLKPLLRRATLARLGLGYDPALRNSEDYYFVADLLAAGVRMHYAPDAGYNYQRSMTSTSYRLSPAHTQAWLDAEAAFRKRHTEILRPQDLSALERRGRVLREVHQLVSALDLVKARRFGSVAGLLASDPATAAFTVTSFARIAVGKVTGRKAFQRD